MSDTGFWAVQGVKEVAIGLFPKGAKTLIDFGGGTGEFAQRALEKVGTIYATTFVPSEMEYTDNVNWVKGYDLNTFSNREELPKEADVVTLMEVLEHLENPYFTLRKLYERTKIGGCCIVSTPNVISKRDKQMFNEIGELYYFNREFEQMYLDAWGEDSSVPIVPILPYLLEKAFLRAGFKNLEWYSEKGAYDSEESFVVIVRGWK